MKGKNSLRVNEPQMLEAIQMWIDSTITSKPKVIAIRIIAPTTYPEPGTPAFYEIDVEEQKT